MSAIKLMDRMIEQLPKGFTPKNHVFVVSKKIHSTLCKELNRNVKTYKKYKLVSSFLCADDKQYLMKEHDLFFKGKKY